MKNRSLRRITIAMMLLMQAMQSWSVTVSSLSTMTNISTLTQAFISAASDANVKNPFHGAIFSTGAALTAPPQFLFWQFPNSVGLCFGSNFWHSGGPAVTWTASGLTLSSGSWANGYSFVPVAFDSNNDLIIDLSKATPSTVYVYVFDAVTGNSLGSVAVPPSMFTGPNGALLTDFTTLNGNSVWLGAPGLPLGITKNYPVIFTIRPGLAFTTQLSPIGSKPTPAASTIQLLKPSDTLTKLVFEPVFSDGSSATCDVSTHFPGLNDLSTALNAGHNLIVVSCVLPSVTGTVNGYDLVYNIYNADTQALIYSNSFTALESTTSKGGIPASAQWSSTNITWQSSSMSSSSGLSGLPAVSPSDAQVFCISSTGSTSGLTVAPQPTPPLSSFAAAFAEAQAAFYGATFSTGAALTAPPSFLFWQFPNSVGLCFGSNFWNAGKPFIDWTTSGMNLSSGSWANGYSFLIVAYDSGGNVIGNLSKTAVASVAGYVFDATEGTPLGSFALPASTFTGPNGVILSDFTTLNGNGLFLGAPGLPAGIGAQYPVVFTIRSGLAYTKALTPIGSAPNVTAPVIQLPSSTDTLTQLWFSPTFSDGSFAECNVASQFDKDLSELNKALSAGNGLIVASYVLPSVTSNGYDLVYNIYNADTQALIYSNSFTTLPYNNAMIPTTAQWSSTNITWQSSSMAKSSGLGGLPAVTAPSAQVFYITANATAYTQGLTVDGQSVTAPAGKGGPSTTVPFTTTLTPVGATPSVANSSITLPAGQQLSSFWFNPFFNNGNTWTVLGVTVPAALNQALQANQNVIVVFNVVENGSYYDLDYAFYNATTQQVIVSGVFPTLADGNNKPIPNTLPWSYTNLSYQGSQMQNATHLGFVPVSTGTTPLAIQITVSGNAPTSNVTVGQSVMPSLPYTTALTPALTSPTVATSTITIPTAKDYLQNWWFSPTFSNSDYSEIPWGVPASVQAASQAQHNLIMVTAIVANTANTGWNLFYNVYDTTTQLSLTSGGYYNLVGAKGTLIPTSATPNSMNYSWQSSTMTKVAQLAGISITGTAQAIQITGTGNQATSGISLAGSQGPVTLTPTQMTNLLTLLQNLKA